MDKLLELLFGQTWWMVLAAAVYGVCWATYGDLYKHEPSRKRWIGHLTQDTWSTKYRKLLGNTLDWIDARLTTELADKEKNWKPDDARTAWSHGLLNLSLVLAIIYPILSVILYWAVTNRDGAIGSLVLIEGGDALWRRATAIGLIAASVGSAIRAWRADDHKRLVYALVAYGLAFAVAFAFAFEIAAVVTFAFAVAIGVAGAFVVAGGGAVGVARKAAGAFARSGKFPRAFAFALAVAGAVVLAVTLAFGVAIAVALSSALPVALAFGVAIAVAFACAGTQAWAGRRTGQRMSALLVFTGIMFLTIGAALRSVDSPHGSEVNGAILFLAILPLLNALGDFASTGLTRWRLREGLDGQMWREMLIGLGGALAAFFLLGALSILAIHYMRWSDGTALVNLPAFFTDIRANPGHYWWLYFTLFSTLIPTALHGALAVFGTGIHLWPGLRRFIVEGLDAGGKGDAVAGRWAVRALCLSMTISVVAPIFVLGHIVTYHGIVGGWVLDLFEGFAQLVGAIP